VDTYEDLGDGAGLVVAAEEEVQEPAEEDDGERLDDDEEQRVQGDAGDARDDDWVDLRADVEGSRHCGAPAVGRRRRGNFPAKTCGDRQGSSPHAEAVV
jgi:hypothetical protein